MPPRTSPLALAALALLLVAACCAGVPSAACGRMWWERALELAAADRARNAGGAA